MADTYFTRTPGSAGNRRTFTWSAWLKRSSLGVTQRLWTAGTSIGTNNDNLSSLLFESNDTLKFFGEISASLGFTLTTSQVFRDISAWYHIVLAVDTTQSTASNRVKLYVNGSQITDFSTETYMSQNYDTFYNATNLHVIGYSSTAATFNGYMAHVNFTDGNAYAASDFGETDTNGQWSPIVAPSVTYGTNGFFLKFANSGSLGTDSSGNGNNFTKNGSGDQVTDTPDNVFCTLNPLDNDSNTTFSEGNTKFVTDSTERRPFYSTYGLSTGKWYWEVKGTVNTAVGYLMIGIAGSNNTAAEPLGNNLYDYAYRPDSGDIYNNGSSSSYGNTFTDDDIIGIALDLDNNKLYFSKNGTWQNSGDPTSGATGTGAVSISAASSTDKGVYMPSASDFWSAGSITGFFNFGNPSYSITSGNTDDNGYGNFEYAPPTGYLALCTRNLSTEVTLPIDNGKDYFNTKQYSGNSGSQSITGVGFQPDLLWIKTKSAAENHVLFNSTRGAGFQVRPNTTGAETNTAYIDSFDTDGWSMNTSLKDTNFNTYDYASWSWLLNGGSTSTNTNGTITSTVQANTTAGISLVTFTGDGNANATVGHGLNAVPEVIIIKNLTNTADPKGFAVNINLSTKYRMTLNANNGDFGDYNTYMGTQTSTNIVFGGTNNGAWNESGQTMMALCFHSVEGYCKIGTWIGNSNADGAFVYTGFRPGLIIHKDTTSSEQWQMHDTGMNPYNLANNFLFPNLTNGTAISNGGYQDILSNGIKIRTADGASNISGRPYFYMAWAENPFVDSTGRPVTAR